MRFWRASPREVQRMPSATCKESLEAQLDGLETAQSKNFPRSIQTLGRSAASRTRAG